MIDSIRKPKLIENFLIYLRWKNLEVNKMFRENYTHTKKDKNLL